MNGDSTVTTSSLVDDHSSSTQKMKEMETCDVSSHSVNGDESVSMNGDGDSESGADDMDDEPHYDPMLGAGSSTTFGGGGAQNESGGWESPRIEPTNGCVQPRVIPPASKPTRHTNQLEYIQKEVLRAVLKHKHSWPFSKPVDSIKLNLPVNDNVS